MPRHSRNNHAYCRFSPQSWLGAGWRWLLAFTVSLCWSSIGHPHPLQPGYLELIADSNSKQIEYDVLWKRPGINGERLQVTPILPPTCTEIRPPRLTHDQSLWVSSTRIRCQGDLYGQTIYLDGLSSYTNDVLVRVVYQNGLVEQKLVKPTSPQLSLRSTSGYRDYFELGVSHILTGFDHLTLVFALMLITLPRCLLLIKTITAFTIGHSVSLALVVLGYIHPASQLVEALIALSIAMLAPEIVRKWRGGHSLTLSYPWLIALIFGLLHGCGFAGALLQIGLPSQALAIPLLLFNLGVEAGQLLFVGLWLIAWQIVTRPAKMQRLFSHPWSSPLKRLPGYTVGSLAVYWAIERTTALLTSSSV